EIQSYLQDQSIFELNDWGMVFELIDSVIISRNQGIHKKIFSTEEIVDVLKIIIPKLNQVLELMHTSK
ncbi:MAG: hypothetical protein ACTSVK_01690, partial [Promethearchaeota archaeon]